MSRNTYSIVEYHSAQEKNRCGYCRNPNTSYSHGMITHNLSVQHYQSLIDRGWRRSGVYCYKPMMKLTCCPLYTIKCEALDFKLTKSQKKILKRMVKFLKNELTKDEEKASPIECDEDIGRGMEISDMCDSKYLEKSEKNASKRQITSVSEELCDRLGSNVNNTESSTFTSTSKQSDKKVESSPSQPMEVSIEKESDRVNFDPSRAPQKKAKLLRIERKQNKLLAQGKTQEEINAIMKKNKQQNTGKTLEDFFNEIKDCSNKLELRLVRSSPMSAAYKKSAKESFQLYKKYQMIVHGDSLTKLTEERYARFLVRSPLREWKPQDGPPQGYGSFHEQYWLNDTLIAVGVIDILPSCVSSVYFFYDPAYSHLSLGTFSSLREVFLTQQLHKYASNLKYYYMGFYIHTCPKMRYKAKMRPSKLLCPETYAWCDIDKCLPKIDASKYSRFNEDPSATDEDGVVDIDQVLVIYHHKAMAYGVYKKYAKEDNQVLDSEIKEYASLVGKSCALNMLYYIDS